MTRRTKETQLQNKVARVKAFSEVLIMSLLIQSVFNFVSEKLGIQLRLAVYETALIWMFCK